MNPIEKLEADLRTGSKILEWEIGDIWGHVGVRAPSGDGIIVKFFRLPEVEGQGDDYLVHFDFSMNKISGPGRIPAEATIYTEIFKARPDVNACVHSHAPMCIALGMADKAIDTMHMQSLSFAGGVPIYPKPIYILKPEEGEDLARVMGRSNAICIKGHGIVTAGKSIDQACIRALYLERTAKIQAVANALGFQKPDPEFIRQMTASWKERAAARDKTVPATEYSPEWRYYKDKIEKKEYWSRGWV